VQFKSIVSIFVRFQLFLSVLSSETKDIEHGQPSHRLGLAEACEDAEHLVLLRVIL
jgi:hypothetical protein